MARNKLATKQVEAYKGGTLQDGEGLMLRDGRWVLRIQVDGKRRDLGLGGVSDVSLKMARERAEEARAHRDEAFRHVGDEEALGAGRGGGRGHRVGLERARYRLGRGVPRVHQRHVRANDVL